MVIIIMGAVGSLEVFVTPCHHTLELCLTVRNSQEFQHPPEFFWGVFHHVLVLHHYHGMSQIVQHPCQDCVLPLHSIGMHIHIPFFILSCVVGNIHYCLLDRQVRFGTLTAIGIGHCYTQLDTGPVRVVASYMYYIVPGPPRT